MGKSLPATLCLVAILTLAACASADTVKRVKEATAQNRGSVDSPYQIETPPVPTPTAPSTVTSDDTTVQSLPGRITVIKPVPERGLISGPYTLRQKRSVWQDGEVQIGGAWETFFVWTGGLKDQCSVGTATLADPAWYVEYPCPRAIGELTITGIDPTGLIVSFTSSSQVQGTFHLRTYEWSFVPASEEAFSPAPQRISAETISPYFWQQVHALRGANDAWMDGEVQAGGFWQPFIVWTRPGAEYPVIGTYVLNGRGDWSVEYACPRSIGRLTITGIDGTGMLVSFTSASGTEGTFHLLTHEWHFV